VAERPGRLSGARIREEPGLHFTCYESVEGGDGFVVVAHYADPAAGDAHVGWAEMGEVRLE
jgi:hypothetical protein